MAHDLILKGGTLIDPAAALHAPMDVAFAQGRVADVAPSLDAASARQVIDCRGQFVAPGMIDLHVHVYWGVSHYGIHPDPHCVAKGVTTAVDAGSAGADTFPGFRKFILEASATRLYAHLNISALGMLDPDIGELEDIRHARVDRALATIEQNRDLILGVKVRLTRHSLVSEAAGMRPLHLARQAADAAGLPIMVHPQDAWCSSIDDILAVMRKGDILTHCYHGMPCGILDEQGRIRSAVHEAVERGVLFDVGHGAGSFRWSIAEAALAQGLQPATISSDLHIYNVNGPVFDLATTVSKFLHLGLSLDDALAKVTAVPAQVIGQAGQLGTLRPGAWGDAVVLDVETGEFPLVDSTGVMQIGHRRIVPRTVVRGGKVYQPAAGARSQPSEFVARQG
ncbi:MAG: amidohydrolase/deacetylase family metallohydrolase [Caldilineaceae bacterium]|nr:amidohydrolase/deacetylase family metallohydrolase [Caldilineaceae bacterium]